MSRDRRRTVDREGVAAEPSFVTGAGRLRPSPATGSVDRAAVDSQLADVTRSYAGAVGVGLITPRERV